MDLDQQIINLLKILRKKSDDAQNLLYIPAANVEERRAQFANFEKLINYFYTIQMLYSEEGNNYDRQANIEPPVMTLNEIMQLKTKINHKKESLYGSGEHYKKLAGELSENLENIIPYVYTAAPAAGGALYRNRKKKTQNKQRLNRHSKKRNNKGKYSKRH